MTQAVSRKGAVPFVLLPWNEVPAKSTVATISASELRYGFRCRHVAMTDIPRSLIERHKQGVFRTRCEDRRVRSPVTRYSTNRLD